MNKNPYENRRKYASMKGAFLGLLSTLPKDFDYRMTKGQGFAILANFPWLGYTRFICQYDKDEVWTSRHRSRSLGLKEIQLMTPVEAVLQVCNLSIAASRGGGRHEIGHAICDRAGFQAPPVKEFNRKVKKHIKLSRHEYRRANLHKWVNLLADIRLERWVGENYPASVPDFFAIQRWVHRLEESNRGVTFAGDFLMALRDKGKGWRDEAAEKVYQEYSQEARDLVDQLEPIWSQVLKKGTLEDTAHLPLTCGLKLLNEIADLVKEPEPPEGDDPSDPDGEGSSSGSGSGSSKGDSSGDEEEGDSSGSGDEDEDGESQGSGDEDEDGDGDAGSGDEEGDSSDGDSSGSGDEGQGDNSTQGGKEGSLDIEKIETLLDGDGEALNPSSAMEENIKVVEKKYGHKIYVPNEKKIIYRKLRLK